MLVIMLLKMSVLTLIYVALTYIIWKSLKDKEMTAGIRIAIGALFGMCSILSTHFGIDYGNMMLNVRDIGPMAAGLFFDPVSGIIAGLIGGLERYYAGTVLGIGTFTTVACSISTCLAGFVAAFMHIFIFKREIPSAPYAFFMGAVMEVFHMYAIFITHRDDVQMAFNVVHIIARPMIIFTGAGLALIAIVIRKNLGILNNIIIRTPRAKISISHIFQFCLFVVSAVVLAVVFGISYMLQTQSLEEQTRQDLLLAAEDISATYDLINDEDLGDKVDVSMFRFHVPSSGTFNIFDQSGKIIAGDAIGMNADAGIYADIKDHPFDTFFTDKVAGIKSFCLKKKLSDGATLLIEVPTEILYNPRESQSTETMMADILIFAAIYILVSLLIQAIITNNLDKVIRSLTRITEGNLDEKVNVYESNEFAQLSDDINHTVNVLKTYIDAAEKRIEQELFLAKAIQTSALPKKFEYNNKSFEIHASMKPAKQVGGDFYDFFFVDADKIALVMADVSGKGIPASLFMMRSKASIRGLAETGSMPVQICEKANNELCEGNEISMFVTAWIGIIDLKTGIIRCVNAGHEYPAWSRRNGRFELLRDKHCPPLGVMEDLKYNEYEIRLEPGDCIFLYTDGIPEAINSETEQYGTSRMLDALSDNRDLPVKDLLDAVKRDVNGFAGSTAQFDDLTIMGFRYNGYTEKNS